MSYVRTAGWVILGIVVCLVLLVLFSIQTGTAHG